MDIVYTLKRHWVKIFGVVCIGSFAFSAWQGWFEMQTSWLLVILGFMFGGFYLLDRRENKQATIEEVRDKSLEIGFKISGVPTGIIRSFKIKDYGRFSEKGKVWFTQLKGNPSKPAVLIDTKGEVIGYDKNITEEDSPLRQILKPREVILRSYPRGKRKVQQTVKIEEEPRG